MNNKIIEKGQSLLYFNTIIQITDNKEVIIENCKKIIEYNDIFLKVKTRNMTVQVWGQKLQIDDYNTEGIIVKGIIESIELINKK
ncbi:MAG: hypothetical protein GX286_02170 [Clostridiales bacterium]|nr:hypothetical protein [Clostridiales bacterium]